MAELDVQNNPSDFEKDEFGDWKYDLVTDAVGRSALDAARDGDPLSEVKRLVENEHSELQEGYRWFYTRSLTEAAKKGETKAVQRLIEAGVDIHACPPAEMLGSALEQAVLKGRMEVVKIILAAEGKQIAKDCYSEDALDQAVQDAQHDEVNRLIKARRFVKAAQINKDQALQHAASLGDMGTARLLVQCGANANAAAEVAHETALSSAASGGHLDMVEYLIQNGAEANGSTQYSQCTPLRGAAGGGHLDVVERLLELGADPNADGILRAASSGGHLAVVERLLGAGASVSGRKQFSSPLQEAALGGHSAVVEILLQAGADVNAPPVIGSKTALQAAAARADLGLVERLLAAGADVNVNIGYGEWGYTALQAAAEGGNIQIVNILLEAGARADADAWGSACMSLISAMKGNHDEVFERLVQEVAKEKVEATPGMRRALEVCAETGRVKFIKRLLGLGLLAEQSHGHHRLFTVAATKGHAEIVKVLLDAGITLEEESDSNRITALQAAVAGGHLVTARVLLSGGADPSMAAGREEPPLHLACIQGNEQIVQLLIDAGADIHAVSYTGKTILAAAEEGGQQTITDLLRRKQAETPTQQKRVTNLDVSKIAKVQLCSTCRGLPVAFFAAKWGSLHSPKWHSSLNSLQASALNGCPFCMFFWKQLGIETITLPQPSEVMLFRSSDHMWSQIDEPFPDDIECPQSLHASFLLSAEPYEGKNISMTQRGYR